MAGRGDQEVKAAVLAALRKDPRDVLDLLEVLRGKEARLLDRREGLLHALLHAMVQRLELAVGPLSERGLARYGLTDGKGSGKGVPPVPVDAASPVARAANRVASGIRHADDRARVAADVAAHLESLESAGRAAAFGSKRTLRHYLRRADRRRPSVYFAADAGDGLRRFALHEGPWILGAVVIFLVVRAFLAEVFVIPSGSMIPTLLPGDRVVVYKPGGQSMPERWTIATFERWGTTYVKRAVGLGGESIALIGGDVYIDGKLAPMPGDLRRALRTEYGVWDFVEDDEVWAKTTEPETGRVTWTYNAGPLWSAAPLGARIGYDVALRDVYATLEVDWVQGDVVELDLLYGRPHAGGAGEESLIRATVGNTGLVLSARTSGPDVPSPAPPGPSGTSPQPGRVVVHLSFVDGLARADLLGHVLEFPLEIPPGHVVTPRVRVSSPRTSPIRLILDKDHHYSQDGDVGHPPDGSDDNPTTYAYEIPEGRVFFLGDNTHNSRDSRYREDRATGRLGAVPVEDLIGPVSFRIWPPGRTGGVR